MEKLSELPPKADTIKTPEETEILNKFFPGGIPPGVYPGAMQQQGMPPGAMQQQGMPPGAMQQQSLDPENQSRINWKMVGLAVTLFVILANPWIDNVLCKIPYCGENSMMLFAIKTCMFLLLLVVINLFI